MLNTSFGVLLLPFLKNQNFQQGIAFRALYVIDKAQKLRQITMNDLPVGRSVDETLRLVQAFQWADEHDDVVPCNWKPGDKTMKPDPKGSLEFFEAEN